MSDAEGTSAPAGPAEAAPAGGSGPEAVGQPAPQQGGGNPNYDSIRSKLGPSFSLVENDLKEMDRLAQERITRSNADVERYTKLGDYDSLSQAYTLNQRLNDNPLEVYNLLAQYLESQGLMPGKEAEGDDEGLEVEQSPQEQQLAELTKAQEEMRGFLQQQEQAKAEAAAEAEMNTQMKAIRESNPHFTDADEKRIYRFAYAAALANESVPDLKAAADELNALRTELLSAPRAGDSAPTLVPSGGGLPQRGETPDYGKQSRQQTQNSVVELLKANKAALGQ